MTTINGNIYNSNPICPTIYVIEGVHSPGNLIFFIVCIIASLVMVFSTIYYLRIRSRFNGMKIRSIFNIALGGFGGAAIVIVISVFNLIGREHEPCFVRLLLTYFLFPIASWIDTVNVIFYKYQLHLRDVTFGVAGKNIQKLALNNAAPKYEEHPLKHASIKEFFGEYYNFLLVGFVPSSKLYKTEDFRRVSILRMALYEYMTWFLLSFPLLVAFIVRMATTPHFQPRNRCTGCYYVWEEFLIQGLYSVCLLLLAILSIRSMIVDAKKKYGKNNITHIKSNVSATKSSAIVVDLNDPGNSAVLLSQPTKRKIGLIVSFNTFLKDLRTVDPHYLSRDYLFVAAVGSVILFVGGSLLIADPGQLMASQHVDYFLFMIVFVFLCHFTRCNVTMYRTFSIHNDKKTNLTLLDVLSDAKGSVLFENYLKSELAYENLQFWRSATKWKMMYDKSGSVFHISSQNEKDKNDFDYTQQMARVLQRTFIGKYAQIPINISDDTTTRALNQFRSAKVVSRMVFDECLIEVYKLMEDGSFRRFVKSKQFLEYFNNRADYSFSTVFNPLHVMSTYEGNPERSNVRKASSREFSSGENEPNKMSIVEYIESL